MGFKLSKSKALTPPDKNTTTQLSTHTTKTTGPALAHSSQNGSATYAETGGRAAATSRHGSAWSKSIAYGGDPSSSSSSSSNQVSSKQTHTYTSGNAIAGVIKGGTFAYAGPGGYGEAAYRDGSRFGASVAYGGEKKGDRIQFRRSDLASSGQSRIEFSCASSGDEGEDSDV